MLFHLPSFLLGYAAGVGTGLILPRLRPVAVEVMASMHRLVDEVAARVATAREGLEDAVAEGRARAREKRATVDGERTVATA